MTADLLPLAVAGTLVTRRYRRRYVGRHHTAGTAPATHLLTPAAYQLVTGTSEPVPAAVDQSTGVLDLRQVLALAGGAR